jgi:hypothetical protein
MGVKDPAAWVKNVERLYRAYDADAVSALYAPDARTRFGGQLFSPDEVHRHPYEWFSSIGDYRIDRTFRAAFGDIIVSETTASYLKRSVDDRAVGDERYESGQRYREYGVDIYWVNDAGKIYHKHVVELVEPDDGHEPDEPVHE